MACSAKGRLTRTRACVPWGAMTHDNGDNQAGHQGQILHSFNVKWTVLKALAEISLVLWFSQPYGGVCDTSPYKDETTDSHLFRTVCILSPSPFLALSRSSHDAISMYIVVGARHVCRQSLLWTRRSQFYIHGTLSVRFVINKTSILENGNITST